ncbi:hypothetical protein Tco_1419614 [Tanacetum coccineum]
MQVTADDDDAFDLGASPDIKSAGKALVGSADFEIYYETQAKEDLRTLKILSYNVWLCGGNLEGFVRIDQLESLMPIMDMKVVTLSEEETPQILVTPCGRGPRSSLRILRPGLSIIEMAVSQFPSVPRVRFGL